MEDPSALLRNQADKQVLLSIRSQGGTESRDVVVTPISLREEAYLRYSEWEYSRRLSVEKLGEDRIGYVPSVFWFEIERQLTGRPCHRALTMRCGDAGTSWSSISENPASVNICWYSGKVWASPASVVASMISAKLAG